MRKRFYYLLDILVKRPSGTQILPAVLVFRDYAAYRTAKPRLRVRRRAYKHR